MLDSGASHSVIKMTYPLPPQALSECQDSANELSCAIGIVPSLELGNHKMGPFVVYRVDFDQPPVDGILGGDFFETYVLLIDLVSKNLFFKTVE